MTSKWWIFFTEVITRLPTKRDKLNKTNQKLQLEYYQDIFSTIEDLPMIEFSAQDGYGKEEIKALIESHILQTE